MSSTHDQPAGTADVPPITTSGTASGDTASSGTASSGTASSGTASSGTVPHQRAEQQRYAAQQPEYGQPQDQPTGRRHYGMAATLMILSGLLTFFIGITGVIKGVFFSTVSTYPFYFSVRGRGVTLLIIGVAAFIVGVALLVRMHWARHVATVVAVISAIANFMFLPFYPFWSIVVLAIDIFIIWDLTHEDRSRRELAALAPLAPHRGPLGRLPWGASGRNGA